MKLRLSFLLIALFILVISASAHSEPTTDTTETEQPDGTDLDYLLQPYEPDFFEFLDSPHDVISSGVEAVAQGMDLFFADEKVYDEATNSYARLSTYTNFKHNGQSSTNGDLHIKVDLKKTKKKLKLLLESDTDRDLQTGVDSSSAPGQKSETTSFYAALQKEISRRREWRTNLSLGIKLKVPLDPYLRVRAHKNFRVGALKTRFTETLFWFNSKGAGASSLFEVDYSITKKVLFRSSTSELWTDFNDYHEVEQIFSIFHELSDRRAISYHIGVYGDTDPQMHLVRYYSSINYRQRVHRDWLFVELIPAISYARDNNFKHERSLTLKLEMVFGSKYIYHPREDDEEDE